jgi:TolB-like protein/Tfp pilus assembly protein PilF
VLLGLGLLVSLVGGLYFLPVDPLGSTSSSARLGPQSVAVLPFTYLASEDSTDYFSLGMTDELVTRLSKIEELSVTGRSSAMQYRGTDKPLPEIGKELGVAYVVGGRVQRVDRHVRIRVQLLRTHTGDVVWAGSFTRSFRNVLQLQADLARKAADELKARVLPSTQEQIRQAAPVDSAAYTLYLQARQLRFEQTPTSLATAARLLRQSVAIDSTFAPAWALLSYCAWTAPGSGLPTAVDPDSLARAAARRALALDSTSAEAHIAMGVVRELLDQNFPAAGPHLRRAVELNPSLANANREYGLYLTRMEQYEAAAPYLEKATRLNPVSPVAFLSLGVHDLYRGQYAQAVAPLQKAVSLQPNNALAHARLALAYAQLGRHNEALRHIRRAKAFEPGAAEHGYLGWAYAHMGRRDSARAVLSRLQTEFTDVPMAPPMRGALHAALGDLDRALDALTKTEAGSIMLRGFPLLDSLRTRPRFQGLLEERGLDDASVEKTMETLRKTPS